MSAYSQLQAWATPEMFINGGNQIARPAIAYASCLEEFTLTFKKLDTDSVYAIDIAQSADGPWSEHIYFALFEPEEISSRRKSITINNDLGGLAWLRARKIFDSDGVQDEIISKPINPLAAELEPPTIEVSDATLLETEFDIPDYNTTYPQMRPMSFYRHGDGNWPIPLSAVEDRLRNNVNTVAYDSFVYRAISKKYAVEYFTNDTMGAYGDSTQTRKMAQTVTITGTSGAVHKWTRDGSEPTATSYIPSDNQIYAWRYDFGGVIKARSFKDGCRSPLTMVAVDKIGSNKGNWLITLVGTDMTASCDLTRHVIRDDVLVDYDSSASCVVNWLGPTQFENHIKDLVEAGTGNAESQGAHPIIKLWSKFVVEQVDYLGWTNHIVGITSYNVGSSRFIRPDGFKATPPMHVHFLAQTFDGFAGTGHSRIIGGGAANRFMSVGKTAEMDVFGGDWQDIPTNAVGLAGLADPELGAGDQFTIEISKLGIVTSPTWYWNVRDDFWNGIKNDLVFVAPPEPEPIEPTVDTALKLLVEDWESYTPSSDADSDVLELGDGFALAWVITTYAANVVLETFDSYTIGEIQDYVAPEEDSVDYLYDNGDGWLGAWVITSPNAPQVENFESYPLGDMLTIGYSGGSGFVGSWVPHAPFGGGETFETYATGNPPETDSGFGDGSYFIGTWFITSY